MPKAAMDENDLAVPGKNNVWTPGEILPMQTKAVAKPMEKRPHHQFGTCVLAADPAHEGRSLAGGHRIHRLGLKVPAQTRYWGNFSAP